MRSAGGWAASMVSRVPRRAPPGPRDRSGLQGHQPRGFSGKGHIGDEFSLKHLPGEQQLAVFVLVADSVGDQGTVERKGEPGGKIAYLVSVRKEHQLRLMTGDKLLQGVNVGVRGVGFERGCFQAVYLLNLVPRQFLRRARCGSPAKPHRQTIRSLYQWLGRRPGFPARRGSAYLPAAPRPP